MFTQPDSLSLFSGEFLSANFLVKFSDSVFSQGGLLTLLLPEIK